MLREYLVDLNLRREWNIRELPNQASGKYHWIQTFVVPLYKGLENNKHENLRYVQGDYGKSNNAQKTNLRPRERLTRPVMSVDQVLKCC
jgi:hypothetical protein